MSWLMALSFGHGMDLLPSYVTLLISISAPILEEKQRVIGVCAGRPDDISCGENQRRRHRCREGRRQETSLSSRRKIPSTRVMLCPRRWRMFQRWTRGKLCSSFEMYNLGYTFVIVTNSLISHYGYNSRMKYPQSLFRLMYRRVGRCRGGYACVSPWVPC